MKHVLNRFKRLALQLEDKKAPVSVCDSCEETYPESWIMEGDICPFCGGTHTLVYISSQEDDASTNMLTEIIEKGTE